MKIETSVNHNKIRWDENLIYTFHILNQNDQGIKDIIFNYFVMDGLVFVGGSVKRQRGMMDIDDLHTDLEIGNLAPNEDATITIELKFDCNFLEIVEKLPIETKCHGIFTFNNDKKIQEKVISNIIYTKIIDHTL